MVQNKRRVSMESPPPASMLLEIRWKHERIAALAQSVHSGAASPSPEQVCLELGKAAFAPQRPTQHATPWTHGHKEAESSTSIPCTGIRCNPPGTSRPENRRAGRHKVQPYPPHPPRVAACAWLVVRSQLGSLLEDTPPSSAMLDLDGDLRRRAMNPAQLRIELGRLMMTASGETCHARQ